MYKKGLVIGILILLIGLNINPIVNSVKTSNGGIIIVDDEGDGDYTSINEAVINAHPWDTIEVYSGTYNENVEIGKPLILIGIEHELGSGEDDGKPVVDACGKGDIFFVYTSHVTITGFRLQNCTTLNNQAINIWFTFSINISNNEITNNWRGIYIYESSDNIVSGNNINNNLQGLNLFNSYSNNIYRNIFKYNDECVIGIWNSHNNRLFKNIITDNDAVGIALEDSSKNNNISMNNFLNNFPINVIFTMKFSDIVNDGNIFYKNFWNRPRIFPKPIFGIVFVVNIGLLPWIIFDWHPVLKPYDIGV